MQLESDRDSVIQPVRGLGHVTIVEDKEGLSSVYPPAVGFSPDKTMARRHIRKHVVFAVVRNIFSWLVSYASHSGGWNPKYRDTDHYDYEAANRGFDYLVKTVADRDADIWPCRRFIHFQVFSDNGDLVTDWLLRNETLDGDLEMLSRELGLTYHRKDRQRLGIHDDYRTYYDDSLVELVRRTWGRELDLLGYTFDGLAPSTALLGRQIEKGTKSRVKYLWESDRLFVDGNEVERQ